jgi:hypothetical protein
LWGQKFAKILNLCFEFSVVGVVFKVSLTPTHKEPEDTVSQILSVRDCASLIDVLNENQRMQQW